MFCVLYCWWKKQDLFTNNSEVPEESHLVLQAVWGEAKERNSHKASWGGWSHSHLIITWTRSWFGEGAISISWQGGWSSGLFCSREDSPWKGDVAFTALLWVEMQQSTRGQSWEGYILLPNSACTLVAKSHFHQCLIFPLWKLRTVLEDLVYLKRKVL